MATVNGEQITREQLADECLRRHGNNVLESVVNRHLIRQACNSRGLSITDKDVDDEITRVAATFGLSHGRWLSLLQEERDLTPEQYRREIVWPLVALKKLADSRVQVTEEDIEKAFVSNYGPRVEVLAIILENQRQAQKVWKIARDNPTNQLFGQLAHQYSVDPISRDNLGKIPPIRRYSGQPDLEKEAFSLNPGELSRIIASGDKYIILRCTGHTTPIVKDLNATVRDQLSKEIHEKKLRLAMTVEFKRLRETAEINNYLNETD